jgi:hypothetical protein
MGHEAVVAQSPAPAGTWVEGAPTLGIVESGFDFVAEAETCGAVPVELPKILSSIPAKTLPAAVASCSCARVLGLLLSALVS